MSSPITASAHMPTPWCAGKTVHLLGRPYILQMGQDIPERAQIGESHGYPRLLVTSTEPQTVAADLQWFLEQQAAKVLPEMVARLLSQNAERLLNPKRITVCDLGRRAIAVTPGGILKLDWRLVICPADLIHFWVARVLVYAHPYTGPKTWSYGVKITQQDREQWYANRFSATVPSGMQRLSAEVVQEWQYRMTEAV